MNAGKRELESNCETANEYIGYILTEDFCNEKTKYGRESLSTKGRNSLIQWDRSRMLWMCKSVDPQICRLAVRVISCDGMMSFVGDCSFAEQHAKQR